MKTTKTAFITALLGGIIAHLYIYTNTIPNFDGISRVYDEQQMTVSGRWFLHYVSGIYGYMQNPMLIGVLAMFFLAAAAVLTVNLFSVKNNTIAGAWGLLSVLTPAIAYTNTYTFTAAAYCFSILLAVMAVWLAANKGYRGFLIGCIALALSMGIYQVYVTVAITLSLYLVLGKALEEGSTVGETFLSGVRQAAFLITGTLLYYGILKIFLWKKNLKLLSYLGMNQVEQGYPVGQLGQIMADTYREVAAYFFYNTHTSYNGAALRSIAAVLVLTCAILLLGCYLVQNFRKENILKITIGVIMIILLPLGVNFGKVMSPFTATSPIMKYSYVYICLLPVILQGYVKQTERIKDYFVKAGVTGACLFAFVFWQQDNTLYTMLNQVHRATLSFVTNVVGRIESCPGYRMGMPVVIVGGYPADRYDTDLAVYDWVEQGAILSSSVIPLNKHIYYYMQDWLNVPIEEPAQEVFEEAVASEVFRNMPLYPDDGSVLIYDGKVIVKMQEEYTPRAQYEIDYENRR